MKNLDGRCVGNVEGALVGVPVRILGCDVGSLVGILLGSPVGWLVGIWEGTPVGVVDGGADGLLGAMVGYKQHTVSKGYKVNEIIDMKNVDM